MDANSVRWETVDYGETAFHVISYRADEVRAETPAAEPAVVQEPDQPCPILAWPLFRCWVAHYAARCC